MSGFDRKRLKFHSVGKSVPQLLGGREMHTFLSKVPFYYTIPQFTTPDMNKEQTVNALFEQFGKGTDLTKSVIGNILEAENGDYDSTVDILLNMTNDVTGIKPKQQQGKSTS